MKERASHGTASADVASWGVSWCATSKRDGQKIAYVTASTMIDVEQDVAMLETDGGRSGFATDGSNGDANRDDSENDHSEVSDTAAR